MCSINFTLAKLQVNAQKIQWMPWERSLSQCQGSRPGLPGYYITDSLFLVPIHVATNLILMSYLSVCQAAVTKYCKLLGYKQQKFISRIL